MHHRRLILIHDIRDGDIALPILFHHHGIVHSIALGEVICHHDDFARRGVDIALTHIGLSKGRC